MEVDGVADEAPLGLGQLGDDAIDGAEFDRLDRHPFAVRSADLIRTIADSSPSLVAGLIGPWGSGKTSLLAMIAEELANDDSWTVVEFNPWELSDLASLIAEFLTTLSSAMGQNQEAREAIAKYAGKIAPLAALIPVVGGLGSAVLKTAGDLLGDVSLAEQRHKLVEALRGADHKMLVLIDDVDRLQGDELRTVLKLVRLVGRLPNVSYVLAYDEMTLLDVLRTTDVAGSDRNRALAYLDKIVQLRLDLPPVSTYRVRAMINAGLQDVTSAHGVVLGDGDIERLSTVYVDCLEPSLVEPRHIKRFFGQIDALYGLVAHEVDFVDFLLITFIRVFYPSVHREVLLSKGELTGTKLEIEKTSDDDRIARWQRKLSNVHGLDDQAVERVMGVLGVLFRRLRNHGSAREPTRTIGRAEDFDRYLYLAIPPDDYPDAKVLAAINEIISGESGGAVEELVDALAEAAGPIVDKLLRFEPPDDAALQALLPFAARVAAATPNTPAFVAGLPARRARLWLTELLRRSRVTNPDALLTALLEHLPINDVAGALLKTKYKDTDENDIAPHLADFHGAVGAELYANLEIAANTVPSELGTEVVTTVSLWEQIAGDPETSRAWFRRQVEDRRWPAEDVAAMFVIVARYENGVEVLSDMNLDHLDHRLGIEWLLERFTPSTAGTPIGPFNESKDTGFEERKRWAHEALAQWAAQRPTSTAAPEGPTASEGDRR